jgi:phosphoglycerate kinase
LKSYNELLYKKIMSKVKKATSLNNLEGQTALLRIDADIDLEAGKITDDTRLSSCIPSMNFLLEKGADVTIIAHLGRPEGEDKKFTLAPVASWFEKELKGNLAETTIGRFKAWKVNEKVSLIENIRYFKEEEDNDEQFSRELALLGDVYINDAFAVSHREHASIAGITKFIPSYAGLHLVSEIEVLSKILDDPKRPLAVLIGGAKIETKLPMVEKMHHVADYVLVGGEIAEQTRVLIKVQHEKISGVKSAVLVSESNDEGTDITPKSVENFCQILGMAATIVWNGPVGITGHGAETEKGTHALAEFIVSTEAYKVVGGGDTLSYLRKHKLLDKFDFVSTGGGAMLEFLSGHKLPGIAALESL